LESCFKARSTPAAEPSIIRRSSEETSADFGAGLVLDREVPGTPVLGVDPAQGVARGAFERATLFPKTFCCTIVPDRAALAVRDLDARFHDLPGPEQLDHLRPVTVVDGQAVREELVEVGDEPDCLLGR